MFRFVVLLVVVVAGIAAVVAAPPTPAQRERVNAILATVTPDNPQSVLAAEEALVREGQALLPAMREALPVRRARLKAENEPCKCLNHWEDESNAARLASEITALDQAIFRLANGVNPRKAITDWAHALKFADGRAFTREFLPLPVTDVETGRLEGIFPAYRFYLVYLPGYQSGAAPPEEVLRAFQVPAPLQAINLFAVNTAGRLALITQAESGLKVFFQGALPPVKTEAAARDGAYAWLRLTTAFWWWNNQPLPFLPIAEHTLVVERGAAWPFLASGTVRVMPFNGNTGRIDVQMAFDAAGRLTTVKETREIELAQLAVPMSAPPVGGGEAAVLQPE
jgi:hypothetical protein